jgi:ABC-type dipeptide/oligopeptide/nickel transport system permease component
MFEIPPTVLAVLTGFIAGLLISIPVGPVNLTIMNEGARNGFKWAALIGLGATAMEVIYCAIAFTSFGLVLQPGSGRGRDAGVQFRLHSHVRFFYHHWSPVVGDVEPT